jgi:hypothetical protein
MEANPNLPEPTNYFEYPGKMDHTTCLCLRIQYVEEIERDEGGRPSCGRCVLGSGRAPVADLYRNLDVTTASDTTESMEAPPEVAPVPMPAQPETPNSAKFFSSLLFFSIVAPICTHAILCFLYHKSLLSTCRALKANRKDFLYLCCPPK